ERGTDAAQAGDGVAGIGGTGAEAGLDEIHFGDDVGEPPGEVGQPLLGCARLPRPDDPLSSRRLHVYRAVVVDPTEACPVAHVPTLSFSRRDRVRLRSSPPCAALRTL